LELRQFECFVAVAEERHFTRAAERLHVAQPAVSRQIQLLETQVGTRLFERRRGGVALTGAGEALLPRARDVLAAVDAARSEAAAITGLLRGRLSMGTIQGTPRARLPALLATYRNAHPMIELSLREDVSEALIDCVRDGSLDVAFVGLVPSRGDDGLEARPIDSEPVSLVVAARHPLAARRRVTIDALRDEPLIAFRRGSGQRALVDGACRRAGFEPRVVFESDDLSMLADLAREGLGVALLPESVVPPRDGLAVLRISRPRLIRPLKLVWRRVPPPPPAVTAFLEVAEGHFKGGVNGAAHARPGARSAST
jgi:DNA-binding transcriptional LysR family regulator